MLLNGLTFELRIMLRKRRMKIEEHKSGIRRRLTIILPAQEAKTGQPLTPMLGQVQISTANFVNEFNKMSLIFENGFPLHVEILVYWEKTEKETKYTINILPIPFVYFVNYFTYIIPEYNNQKYIYSLDLIRLVNIFKILYNRKNYDDSMIFMQILSVLKSHDVNISLLSEQFILSFLIYFYVEHPGLYLICHRLFNISAPVLKNPKYVKRVKRKLNNTNISKIEVKKNKKKRRYGISKS